MTDRSFLSDQAKRSWTLENKHGLLPTGLFIGKGAHGIEVAVAQSAQEPTSTALIESWRARRSGRATPVLLVVLHPRGASICGPTGERPPNYPPLDIGQVERLAKEVLNQPDRHAALRYLKQALPSMETVLPGISNEGLVALHELQRGVPDRADWAEAAVKASRAVKSRGRDLIRALGFEIQKLDNLTDLLRSGDRRTALAVMLHESESAEAGAERFNSLSPVSYALAKADAENLPWVILVQGDRIRLYSTSVDAGVGRRGRTETFIECQTSLLSDEHLPYLWLLYSAEALIPEGSIGKILEDSQRFAGELAKQLRERIYDTVVPMLAQGIAEARRLDNPSSRELRETYEMALVVLFRLLFIAYAEDRDLLPYKSHEVYRRRSLKQKAQELADYVAAGHSISGGSSHWQEVSVLWQSIAKGNREWGVPAYNGGLFDDDPEVSQAGFELSRIVVPNARFEEALRALLVVTTKEGVPGPVDFRALGVREFGTIYEGLLESELALAATDLAVTRKGVYVPANIDNTVTVASGNVYLHNRSGERKSSGSYYTKHFAVEHLLDGSLEPALAEHLDRLVEMGDADASEAFFDFRVADIAMGSGHFLVAAIDRIEKGMADFLAKRNLAGVRAELEGLREAARQELGGYGEAVVIEDGALLRRLIARKCIYGVDAAMLSVQLARLSIWIHTFVPGLPLSFLDRTLVHGNSLIGVGTVDEIRKRFVQASGPMIHVETESLLGRAAKPLGRLAKLNDATLRDVASARVAMREVNSSINETRALCDLVAAGPVSNNQRISGFPFESWESFSEDSKLQGAARMARQELADLQALHFPVAFPEVFLRERPGFDAILGNPPWQEATLEEHAFWARYFPGLRSLPQGEQEAEKSRFREERPDLVTVYEAELAKMKRIRKSLVSGAFPGMGTGDPDFYKAFCWRFWNLSRAEGGRIGVVLPRSALAAKGSEKFRLSMFDDSRWVEITMLLNNRKWVFDEVHPQYSIGLVCITRGSPGEKSVRLRGPFASLSRFKEGAKQPPTEFDPSQVLTWNDSASLPLLPSERSVEIFKQLRKAPRLDLNIDGQWRARPDREMDATNQKFLMDVTSETCPEGYWPVYKGESFDIWNPDTGDGNYYAYADPEPVFGWLQQKRSRAQKGGRNSAHREFPLYHVQYRRTLPCFAPRIAFRDVSRATDTRTVRAALVPPRVFIANQAPYLLWPRGEPKDQAYLLGFLSSIPLDWYARRFVETHVNFFVFNPFPVPRPPPSDELWRRVVELAGRLACPDDRFADWAEEVGIECGLLQEDEKEDKIYEMDAVVAHLFGLTERQLVHIFETFHEGWDFGERLEGVRRHYRWWTRRR